MDEDRRSWSAGKEAGRTRLGWLIWFLTGRFHARAADAAGPSTIDPPRSVMRKLYDDIGNFLFAHRLDLTPLNFGCAHDYVAGSDRRIIDDVDGAIRERRLSNGWIEDYLARQDSHVVMPDALHDTTVRLEEELRRCLELLVRSAGHQERYGSALEASVRTVSPDGLFAHLRDLTRCMIEQNRLAEREMRQSHARVSQLRATLRSARQASKHDHLTGLPNRRGFERIVETWQGSQGSSGAVLAICDIDHFKAVNDRFGHDAGDRVLKFVAEELGALTERKHEVARIGGEEFVILMQQISLEQAACDVDSVRLSLAARRLVDSVTDAPIGTVTFSAGLAVLQRSEALPTALRRADTALYAAKRAGRNRIHAAAESGRIYPLRW